MKNKDFTNFYIDQLKDLYSAETQLVAALPKLTKAASSPKLQEAFKSHLEETKVHIQRLDTIFKHLDSSPSGKKCKGMEGLIEEGTELLKEKGKFDPDVMDAGLIAAAQRCEHYEIAVYGTLRTFAQQFNYTEASKLLQQTLDEEHAADQKLTALAVGGINQEAQVEG